MFAALSKHGHSKTASIACVEPASKSSYMHRIVCSFALRWIHQGSKHLAGQCPWAAQYDTWRLTKLTPKGSLFFAFCWQNSMHQQCL